MKILGHASYVGNTGYNAHSKGFFRALSKKTQTKVRNFTVGPNWSGYVDNHNDPHHQDVTELDKSILISQSLFNSDRNLQDFPLYNNNEPYVPDVNIILNGVNHYYFYQNYKGPKIGYVVWENTLYPEDFFSKLLECDQVWVPTEWQAKITIDQGIPSHKVKIVREAVNPEIYNTVIAAPQDDIFTFVMFGAWGYSLRNNGAARARRAVSVPAKPTSSIMAMQAATVAARVPGRKAQSACMMNRTTPQLAAVPTAAASVPATAPRMPNSTSQAARI